MRQGVSDPLDTILSERGVIEAAHAGHAAAAEIAEIEWHDNSYDSGHLTHHDEPMARIEDPLVKLLNLDPGIIEARMKELAAERDAVIAYPGTVSLPGLTDVPRFQQSWERWSAVRTLQRLGDALIPPDEAACDSQQLLIRDDRVRLRGTTVREEEALRACLCRAELATDVAVAAGWPGEGGGFINYQLPDEDHYAGPLRPEQQVDMIVYLQRTAGADTSPLDVWIRRCLRLLVGHALAGRNTVIDREIQLGRCLMPAAGRGKGPAAMQDYLLGEGAPPPDRCNRWYTRHRGTKETCGSRRCMDIKASTSRTGLNRRALELAENYCVSAGLPIDLVKLHTEWQRAVRGNSPRIALRRMKELIDRRRDDR